MRPPTVILTEVLPCRRVRQGYRASRPACGDMLRPMITGFHPMWCQTWNMDRSVDFCRDVARDDPTPPTV